MMADDLNAPLGQHERKRRRKFPVPIPQVIAAALALFVGVFVAWAVIVDDPFGGEPMVAVPIASRADAGKGTDVAKLAETAAGAHIANRYDGPRAGRAEGAAPNQPSGNTKTVTIIDGKTGTRQEVVIPAGNDAKEDGPAEQKFEEVTPHGPIPKIATDGTRPAEAFAVPVKPLPGRPDAPRVALIVAGLGISTSGTAAAITRLPAAVTLAFMPYGADVAHMVARARGEGHEILLQVPMEPFNYPDNDSGPQTLLTSLTPAQNLDRLHWLMARFQGYVGIAGAMGARFTASEQAFSPVLHETAKRGLIFVDDGTNPRSVAGRIAGADNLPFAKADMVLDSVPTPVEIDHALGRLEMAAREHGVAVGISSALPVSIDRIVKWAKAAEARGFLLVPITAVALKAKQS
ncbi:MAG: divergent polysaccharide deacetylase family protein [Hyphomicrobiales bacterium]|nr:divergent polysaccharide deacetylase family protein [Hyphomicrobiales bacterium]